MCPLGQEMCEIDVLERIAEKGFEEKWESVKEEIFGAGGGI